MLVVSCTSFACIVSNDARVTPYVACANHTPHHGEEYTYGGGECTLEVWEKGGRRERGRGGRGEKGRKGGKRGGKGEEGVKDVASLA